MKIYNIILSAKDREAFVNDCICLNTCVIPTTDADKVYIAVPDSFRFDLFMGNLKHSHGELLQDDLRFTALYSNWQDVEKAIERVAATTLHVVAPAHVEEMRRLQERLIHANTQWSAVTRECDSLRSEIELVRTVNQDHLSNLQRSNKELEAERHECYEAVRAQTHLLDERNQLAKALDEERERRLHLEKDYQEAKRMCGAELVEEPSYMNIRVGDMFVSRVQFKSWAAALEFLLHKGFTYQGKGMYNRGDTEVSIVYPKGNDVNKYVETNVL